MQAGPDLIVHFEFDMDETTEAEVRRYVERAMAARKAGDRLWEGYSLAEARKLISSRIRLSLKDG